MVRNLVTKLEEGFLSLLLVSMTLLVFAEVVARFGFNAGIHWAQEVTLLIAAWFVLYLDHYFGPLSVALCTYYTAGQEVPINPRSVYCNTRNQQGKRYWL